jgi:hypothetical protein
MSTCINKGDHLWVEVKGAYSLQLLLSAIHEIADRCRDENLNKVLIDLRNMDGNPKLFDRFQIGMEIVKAWGSRIKVAVIAKPGIVNRMMENTAVNRGVKLFSTTSSEDAAQWLEIESQDQTIGE